jgi:hypothetical protein
MQRTELRNYCGDYEDVAEFWNRVWIPEYAGKMWMTCPEPAFLRWLVGSHPAALRLVAYQGEKLVGSAFSLPYSLRMGASVRPIAWAFGLAVDPDHRRLALPLVEWLRRENAERGIAFAIGTVVNHPASPSYRFWTKYAQALPRNLTFLFPIAYWVKILAPKHLAQAGIAHWERLSARLVGPLVSRTPRGLDPRVRPYRSSDLDRCVEILEKATARFDWALVWARDALRHRLEGASCGSLVLEHEGRVQAMVNYHRLIMQGRKRIQVAVLALWADDNLTPGQRTRLLGHVCSHLREQGVHCVVAPRCAMMPGSAFAMNLFLPTPAPWRLVAFGSQLPSPLAAPKTWSLLVI